MPRKRRTVTDVPTVPSTPPDALQGTQSPTEGQRETRVGDNGETQDAVHMTNPVSNVTENVRELAVIDALIAGQSYREIAAQHRLSFTAIADVARRMNTLNKESVSKLLQIKALDAVEAWAEAMKTGAKMGKHAPARDLLTHTKLLDPVQSDGAGGAKVAIIIGQPGQPVGMDALQVIHTQAVSGDE